MTDFLLRASPSSTCARRRIDQQPMSALPMLGDHLGEPFRGIVPVRLDRVLRRARIALRNRRRDRVVLTNRSGKLGEEDVDVEPSVSLALRLDRAVEGDDAWTR